MCGIIGIVSRQPFTTRELLSRLKRVEYRGYDSYGYWDGERLVKRTGKIAIEEAGESRLAISHTRWATTGPVTRDNAHPHRAGNVTIVHNGIIENWRELRASLEAEGAVFTSKTDSEVIAHYLAARLAKGERVEEAMRAFIREARGTFATLVTIDGDDRLYAMKRDSPLALGMCEDLVIVASDSYAFNDLTRQAFFFENEEYAVITPAGASFFDKSGARVEKKPCTVRWEGEEPAKKKSPHFMIKEIHEEPEACERLIASLGGEQEGRFAQLVTLARNAEKVVFTAAGTAYHASLLGAALLHRQGREAQAIIASEFENFIRVTGKTLIVAVTQSGETMDVIEALKYAGSRGATIAAIVNVPYSTIDRMASLTLRILAGQEVSVASTKAFTNQATILLAIAKAFGHELALERIPEKLSRVLSLEPLLERLAARLARQHDLYVLGRSLGYPVAREIALKIKEVSYLHAEGMMAGELKHGTIALIEDGTPVLSLVYDGDPKMANSTDEVRSRGAEAIVIGTREGDDFRLPAENEAEFCLLAATAGQLLAYHVARLRGCPVDTPRNLAKSVTVL